MFCTADTTIWSPVFPWTVLAWKLVSVLEVLNVTPPPPLLLMSLPWMVSWVVSPVPS